LGEFGRWRGCFFSRIEGWGAAGELRKSSLLFGDIGEKTENTWVVGARGDSSLFRGFGRETQVEDSSSSSDVGGRCGVEF
jgi:hypothetical protein